MMKNSMDEQITTGEPVYNLEHEQARLMHYQAEMAALETQQLRDSLMTREELENVLVNVYAQMRAQLLALPGEQSSELYKAQNAADHNVMLTGAIYEILDAMPLGDLTPDAETRVYTETGRLVGTE